MANSKKRIFTARLRYGASAAVLAACMLPMPDASAQTGSQNAGRVFAIEEITVTARKREERLQDIPLAVTAFTADQMNRRLVRTLGDIAALTPGLNFETYLGGSGTPVIRGAAQNRITDLDQNVSTFFDNVYLPRQYAVSPGVIGLERVEVVKGPQSALYGRNAFMGAINYIPKKPGDVWSGTVEGTIGLHKRYDLIGDIGGPIIAEKVFLRVGGGYSKFDGDVKNNHPNAGVKIDPGSSGRVNGWENKSIQARLIVKPTETIELDGGIYHFNIFQEVPATIRITRATNDTNCGNTVAGRRTLFCGELPWAFVPPTGSRAAGPVNVDPRGIGLDAETTIIKGRASWRPDDRIALIYEYGHAKTDAISGGGSDKDPVAGQLNIFAPTAPFGNQWQVSPAGDYTFHSHELRAEYSPLDGLDLMLGGYTSKLRDFDFFPLSGGLPLLGTQPYDINSSAFIVLSRGRTTVDAKAVFGRVAWQATEALRFSAEARYAEEDKTLVNGPTTFSAAIRTLNGTWNQFTPRFTADYKFGDDNLLYASIAKGAKSGGFNLSALVPSQFEFQPDRNWTYEIGTKNTFFDNRLQLNAAVFYVDWSNQQVGCSAQGSPLNITPPAVICNIGKAKIKGFEIDATFLVAEGLTLSGGFSFNDAKFESGIIDDRIRDLRLCDNGVCAANGDVGGKQLPRQSKIQGQLGFQYERPLTPAFSGFIGGDLSYKSKQYGDTMNLAWIPARWLANASAGVRGENWEVSVWAKNLFDKQYAASAFVIFAATDSQYIPLKGASRTVGLTARYRF
jgi:iron complex outermembrane receptor protein